jgi:hypothetical protein
VGKVEVQTVDVLFAAVRTYKESVQITEEVQTVAAFNAAGLT